MLVDLLHLCRNIHRSPSGAVAAVLTLSLTLGAGASIFAVVDAVLLTPPPFADATALVTVGEVPLDEPSAAPRAVSYATFAAWRERAGSLGVAAVVLMAVGAAAVLPAARRAARTDPLEALRAE